MTELKIAMAAIQSACKAVNSELGENPNCEKPKVTGQVKMDLLYDVMKGLYSAFENLGKYVEAASLKPEVNKKKLSKLEEKVLDLESDKDALAQKWKVGTIVIQSNPKAPNPKVKPEKEVRKEDLATHAAELIMLKTGVEINSDDLSRLHYIPGGGLKLKFKDQKFGSKFRQVVAAIKKPNEQQKLLNLYCNFKLTKMRNNLLYEVRQAKKKNQIAKYFVDFNGAISVQIDLQSSLQVKLTRLSGVSEQRGEGEGYRTSQPARTHTAATFREFLVRQV